MVLPLNNLKFSAINQELSRTLDSQLSLNDPEARELAETGNSGQDQTPGTPIRTNNLRLRARNAATVSGLSQNFQLENTAFGGNYSPGYTLFKVLVNNSGVVGSSTRSTPAIRVTNILNGDVAKIVNNGRINGAGGSGGAQGASNPGIPGGPAINIANTNGALVRIVNSGQIYGGGGGGGGGARNPVSFFGPAPGGAGGGGGGYVAGPGGFSFGSPGTLDAGGAGAPGLTESGQTGGAGGPGGAPGFSGTVGGTAEGIPGGAGGLPGSSIIGSGLFNVIIVNNGVIRPNPS
jgi:hypothetical protein